MNRDSYYEDTPSHQRIRYLGRGHAVPPAGRSTAPSSASLASDSCALRAELRSHGPRGTPAMPQSAVAVRSMAGGRHLPGSANVIVRSFQQRFFLRYLPKHCGRNGRRLRRLDAGVLRRSPARCSPVAAVDATCVNTRPNLLAGESMPPAPSQKRSMDKRARLHAAARALFGEKGYEAASIEEMAAR